jgi:hypothetical protein
MSSGHGHIERAILRTLRRRRNGADALSLACAVSQTNTPTRAQLESVRRALRSLQRQRLIVVTPRSYRIQDLVRGVTARNRHPEIT